MRCPQCSKDVQPTRYGRCPLCGAVAAGGAAEAVDARAMARARARGPDEAEPPDGGCASCMALLIGVPALFAFIGLVHVGQRNRWTSDGPGMLIIMLGVAFTGILVVSTLGAWFLTGTRLGRRLSWWHDRWEEL